MEWKAEIAGLFNDAFNGMLIMTDELEMMWKWLWLILKYNPRIFLEGLGQTT
jgi:hypothetical protein